MFKRGINDRIVTYRLIEKALKNFRSQDLSDNFNLYNMNSILNQIRERMNVDEFTNVEERKETLKEIIPFLALEICTMHEIEK